MSTTIFPPPRPISSTAWDKGKDARPRGMEGRGCLPAEFLSPLQACAQSHGRAGLVRLFAYLLALYPRAQPPRVLVGNRAPCRGVQLFFGPRPRARRRKSSTTISSICDSSLSGRTLWVGATPVSEAYPMANYNCAFEVIDDFHAYHDLFYLLMIGSGCGRARTQRGREKAPQDTHQPGDRPQGLHPAPRGRAAGIHQRHLLRRHRYPRHWRFQGGLGAGDRPLLPDPDQPGIQPHPPRDRRIRFHPAARRAPQGVWRHGQRL